MLVNTETKREYPDIDTALSDFCMGRLCDGCPFDTAGLDDDESCLSFAKRNPEDAMCFMGLEDSDDMDESFEFDEDAFKDLIHFPMGSPRLSEPNP